jgi:hypothetical protein
VHDAGARVERGPHRPAGQRAHPPHRGRASPRGCRPRRTTSPRCRRGRAGR